MACFVALTLLIAAPAQAATDPVEVGLQVSSMLAADSAWDRPAEDRLESWTRLQGQAAGPAGEGRWRLAVLAEVQLRMGAPSQGGDTESAFEIQPWESGWEGPIGPLRLAAGHLIERWGRLDLLPVTDVLAGRDLRAGLLTPPDLMRLPAPLLRLQAGGDRARAELSLLPFGTQDRLSIEGTDSSILRQNQVAGLISDASTWDGDALTGPLAQQSLSALAQGVAALDPPLRQSLFAAGAQAGRPMPGPHSADVGLRLEAEGRGVDVALVGAWMRSRRPLPDLDPGLRRALVTETLPGLADQQALLDSLSDPLSAAWPRTAVAGAELATTLGPVGLRLEGLWQSDKVLLQRWLRGSTRPSLATGLGLDWALGTRLQLVAELRQEHIFDPPPDLLLSLPDDLQIAGGLRLALWDERIFIEPGALASVSFGEVASRIALRWRIVDAWELSAGAVRVDAPRPAPGSIKQALSFTGGPLGALSDTDNLWLGLRWIR